MKGETFVLHPLISEEVNVEFGQLMERAVAVRAQYAELERKNFGAAWSNEELALGFVGDVGDLAKLVMAQNGRRKIPGAKDKVVNELAECLWSAMVLARVHQIDLEHAFPQTMEGIVHLPRVYGLKNITIRLVFVPASLFRIPQMFAVLVNSC